MGVTRLGNRRFRARYSLNGKRYNVGTFKTRKEAQAALGAHYWDNPEMLKDSYLEAPVENFKHNPAKPTLKERVKAKWQSVRESLEKRSLI